MTAANGSGIDGYMGAFRRAFEGIEHQSFHRAAGQLGAQPGALLVHGLVGTPAEMRPVAEVLYEAGWSVEVPLLPGHGIDIERLFDITADAWVSQARASLDKLRAEHRPILIVGHSMGAAVALRIVAEMATADHVCGLILISPFVRLPLDNVLLRALGPLLQRVIPRMRPFKNLDFDSGPNSEEMREGVGEFMPELDLDDPGVQAQIRQMAVPTRILGQLGQLGKAARQAAPSITLPTLILQGTEDEVARPAYSRQLLVEMGGPVTYHEFAAAHNLVRPERPAWEDVAAAVRAFSDRMLDGERGIPAPEPVVQGRVTR